jgi:hypothetical protein
MQPLKAIKSKFILLSLSVFYDAAFADRLWTDVKIRRAMVGMAGILITGAAGAVLALDRMLILQATSPVAEVFIIGGAALFLAGNWKGRISLGFNIEESRAVLRSRRTVICRLSDVHQASAYIEAIMEQSQREIGENYLKATEPYLILASEIWFESLAKKGFDLIGEMNPYKNVGDIIARQTSMSSM